MPVWMHITKAGRFWARHRDCSVELSPVLGTSLGYIQYYECRKHWARLYVDTGIPYLPYWASQ